MLKAKILWQNITLRKRQRKEDAEHQKSLNINFIAKEILRQNQNQGIRQMERKIDEMIDRWKDRQIERQIDGNIDRWKDRYIERQIDGKIDRWKDRQME